MHSVISRTMERFGSPEMVVDCGVIYPPCISFALGPRVTTNKNKFRFPGNLFNEKEYNSLEITI
jgi:hypothetical protein